MRISRVVAFALPVIAMTLLTCDDPIEQISPSPDADLVARACAQCEPVARAAIKWLRGLEGIPMDAVVVDLAKSGRESLGGGDRILYATQLREVATSLGAQHGFWDDVLDCDDARILEDRPRCQMRRGGLLVTVAAPVIRGSTATIELQRFGPGPGGEWWLARYELELQRRDRRWRVVAHELTTQS